MNLEEAKNRLQKILDESKLGLTDSVTKAESYDDWKEVYDQISEVLSVLNGIEFIDLLLKDESNTKTE